MRVLQVVDSLAAGGLERVAVLLSRALLERGHRVFLCVTRTGGALEESLPDQLDVLWLRRWTRFDLRAIWRLRRFVQEESVEVVHAHGTSLFITALALAGLRKPVLVWHDHFGDLGGRGRSVWPFRIVGPRIDGAIPVSRELERWQQEYLSKCGTLIQRVLNATEDFGLESVSVESPFLGEGVSRIIAVANFRRQKDHITLINAFSRVSAKFQDVRLYLVGELIDHEYVEEVRGAISKAHLEERVEILGPRSDVPALLAHSDIGVLSSRSEGLPLSLLEYGAAGLGVVVTAIGEMPSVVEGGYSGMVVPPGDVERLSSAIEILLGDPDSCFIMGQRLKDHVTERFGVDRMLEDVVLFYERLLQSGH